MLNRHQYIEFLKPLFVKKLSGFELFVKIFLGFALSR